MALSFKCCFGHGSLKNVWNVMNSEKTSASVPHGRFLYDTGRCLSWLFFCIIIICLINRVSLRPVIVYRDLALLPGHACVNLCWHMICPNINCHINIRFRQWLTCFIPAFPAVVVLVFGRPKNRRIPSSESIGAWMKFSRCDWIGSDWIIRYVWLKMALRVSRLQTKNRSRLYRIRCKFHEVTERYRFVLIEHWSVAKDVYIVSQ